MRDRSPRVAIVAVDLTWEDDSGAFAPFSYAAYKLDASLRSSAELCHVESRVFDLQSADSDAFFEALRDYRPTLVAASTYIWSVDTFVRLAEKLRQHDPTIRFVMGGPSARESVLKLPPYRERMRAVDAVVEGEGEQIMRMLVAAHDDPEWQRNVPGLAIPGPLSFRRSAAIDRPVLDDYPTPYHVGAAPPGKMGFLETFRGCPIACAFCQWGEQRSDRVHSYEYLKGTLEALDESLVTDVMVLDAAFNLSPRAFRNFLRAERDVGALRSRRVQGHIYPTRLKEEHYELFELVGDFRGSIGIQSLVPEALQKIGRPFDRAKFDAAIDSVRGHLAIDTEFIMGLPGDSPESFRETLHQSIEMSDTVRVFWCLALPDAFLEKAAHFGMEFDPLTFKVQSCDGWTEDDLHREWEYAAALAAKHQRGVVGDNWMGFACSEREQAMRGTVSPHGVFGSDRVEPETIRRLRASVGHSGLDWRLDGVTRERDSLCFALDSPHGSVMLAAEPARVGMPSFVTLAGVAYSHRGELARRAAPELRRVIDAVHSETAPLIRAIRA